VKWLNVVSAVVQGKFSVGIVTAPGDMERIRSKKSAHTATGPGDESALIVMAAEKFRSD
jgi:hypothetical protein